MTETRRLTLLPGAVRLSGDGPGNRRAVIRATTETVDSYGESVVMRGARTVNFRKRRMPILRDHDSSRPVARGLDETIASNGHLTIEFPPEGVSRDADETYGLIKADVLCGVSIGFTPIKMEPMDPKKPYGPQRHLEWDLVEVSIVALAANPDARVLAKANRGTGDPFDAYAKRRVNEMMARMGQPPRYTPAGKSMSEHERVAWGIAQIQRKHTKLLLDDPRYAHLQTSKVAERIRDMRARSSSKR